MSVDGLLPLCGALAAEMAALPLSQQGLTRCFYASMLLGALEGASLINWALGRSNDPLPGFNHLLETLATRSSLIYAG